MLKFNVHSLKVANRLSKGDHLDKSVESIIANCPEGKSVMVEPAAGGCYKCRIGTFETLTATVVKPREKPEKVEKPIKVKKEAKPKKTKSGLLSRPKRGNK